ncbi:hypothetical protein H3N56_04500 [Cetobacterium sp. 2A]|uniref:hypothetical protein n=1 Tax=Cetobacterium sp. 2A TaxID=2754723 RepID=UPI00163CE807|nr:hypothetical protein [Cetobacterium sp. 2A]MBC2855759.1 hypothetical protein [Cetobacterium sp. 2A]
MNRIEFKNFAIEVILEVLKIANAQIDEYNNIGDISATEIIQKDVIDKYEKIYLGIIGLDFSELEDEKFYFIETTIEEILKNNNLSSNFIKSQQEKRENLKGNSGAEVVKNLFDYELSKLLNAQQILIDKINIILDQETILENELKDTIQEEAQFDIIYKLQPVREEYRVLEAQLLKLDSTIKTLRKKINFKWNYEIYGTISKDELLKVYKNSFKMGE